MTVQEFIKTYVSRWADIRVIHFPETDESAEVVYEGRANSVDIPDDVNRRIVSSVIAVDYVLCLAVYKEDEQ